MDKMDNNIQKGKGFSSRWGLILTLIGLSVGTGNIWRFPRMAALNGGGSFVLAWTVMMVIVSIPVIIAEIVIGRSTRHGVPGAFKDFVGKKFTWMGTFICITVISIASYYTVVMAWILQYIIMTITKSYYGQDLPVLFETISNGNIGTVICFIISLAITAVIVVGGVNKSIEKVQKTIVPILFILLAAVAVRALTLPGAGSGLNFMFDIKREYLFSSKTWLNALTQTAWSVGPGWGLVLTYAVFTQAKSDVALNEFVQGFGNNIGALLGGLAVIPAIFALAPSIADAEAMAASGNNGLTFIALAGVFEKMAGGQIIGLLFFIALYLAALSSNIGHFLLGTTAFVDAGWSRKKTVWVIFGICLVWGIPSAWNSTFFENQDWVAGLALLIGTLFTCFAVVKLGTKKIRDNYINIPENELYVGAWWDVCVKFVAPAVIVIMIGWWTIQSISWYPDTWWNPFETYSMGTFFVQAGIYALIAFIFNNAIANSVKNKYFNGESYPPIPEEHS